MSRERNKEDARPLADLQERMPESNQCCEGDPTGDCAQDCGTGGECASCGAASCAGGPGSCQG